MRYVLPIVLFALTACSSTSSSESSSPVQKSRRPNIVIFFADDAGFADFGFQGSPRIRTPNIDKLAASGVVFSQGYVSGAVCSPSRAGLLTGRYQQRFGHEYNIGGNFTKVSEDLIGLPVSEKTIADHLRSLGYTTGLVGKWHLGERPQFHPLERGFDEFFGMLAGSSPYHAGKANKIVRGREPVKPAELSYLTDTFGDEASAFVRRHKDEPFFLLVSFNAPHTPMQARADHLEVEKARFQTKRRAVYAAMTRSLDDSVGKVMRELEQQGLAEDTLVIMTNDNGGAMPYNGSLNAPLSGTKGTFLEGGIRVPMTASWPGVIKSGSRFEHPVITLDFLPTLVAAGGGQVDALTTDGRNLLPFLSGSEEGPPHRELFWRLGFHGAVRQGEWKLIWFEDRPPRLYHVARDPGELKNLAAQEPERTHALLQRFHAWQGTLAQPLWRTHPRWKQHSLKRYDQTFVDSLKRD